MKILSIDDMLAAAQDCHAGSCSAHRAALEKAASDLATHLADHLGIRAGPAVFEREFGGLCATFYPLKKRQRCPKVIHAGDPGGDWEMPKGGASVSASRPCEACGGCGWLFKDANQSGSPGITGIERCDLCEKFSSDFAAAANWLATSPAALPTDELKVIVARRNGVRSPKSSIANRKS